MNSYQKLKLKIKQLEDDLRIMVNHPSSMEAEMISKRHKMKSLISEHLTFGDTRSKRPRIEGILNRIN